MPGRNLSNEEQRLLRFWDNPPPDPPRPLLRSIEVNGDDFLRALSGVRIPFSYPITAICGKNGTGKSTALALAALAFHSPEGWYVPWTNARYRSSKRDEDRSYYIFPDFFFYGRNEQAPNGVEITWRYHASGGENAVQFRKTATRWGVYSRRPEREVAYSSLSRMIPAHEMNSVRDVFRNPGRRVTRHQFDEEYRGYFAYIMGIDYQGVEVQKTNRLSFANCTTHIDYSAFNMGGGEGCVIEILHQLRSLPNFGFLAIEEVESCLHPEAQVRLVEVLTKICYAKKIQVVCSTHSEVFLDALPRQARLLLTHQRQVNAVVESPSTRFAVHEMRGELQPELTIYCEDQMAAVLIEESLLYEYRQRVRILDVGSDVTVIRQGVCHLRGGFGGRCLCVLDGDCMQQQIEGWITSETGGADHIAPCFIVLPGDNLPPERWILAQLAHEAYRDQFAEQLGCGRDVADGHVNVMNVDLDHHDIAYTLSQRTGYSTVDCVRRIVRSVASNHPGLQDVKQRIAGLLD